MSYLWQIINLWCGAQEFSNVCHYASRLNRLICKRLVCDMMRFLIWNNYIIMILFAPSLSLCFAAAVPSCPHHHDSLRWRRRCSSPLRYLTHKLAAAQLLSRWNNLKSDRITSTMFCSGTQNLTHRATDFLLCSYRAAVLFLGCLYIEWNS